MTSQLSSLNSRAGSKLNMVMLIDDDDTTNYLNKRLLKEKMQVTQQVVALKNGKEALTYLEKACAPPTDPSLACPDLILLDIKMPVMDGFEFLEAYERLPIPPNGPVLLMLTSSASFYDLERLKQYKSVRRHIAKALDKFEVREIMQAYFPA